MEGARRCLFDVGDAEETDRWLAEQQDRLLEEKLGRVRAVDSPTSSLVMRCERDAHRSA